MFAMRYHVAAISALAIISLLAQNQPASGATSRAAATRRPHDSSSCVNIGQKAFVGVNDSNEPTGTDTAILGGKGNFVCDDFSGVGAGQSNVITSSGSDQALYSFVGAGVRNRIDALAAFVGAGENNVVTGEDSAVVAGYGSNISSTPDSFIGGGQTNSLYSAAFDTIGGGYMNEMTNFIDGQTQVDGGAYFSWIGGGMDNNVEPLVAYGAAYAAVAGGISNNAYGEYAVVGGGNQNVASGYLATVPGGYRNIARGETSFAGGYTARAATPGSFVWADYSPAANAVTATKPNQFLVRATGGAIFYSNAAQNTGVALAPGGGAWGSSSDRNVKERIVGVDDAGILAKLDALPVSMWSYTSENRVRHVGPMAQDFYAAFGVGADDRHIATID